MPFAGRGLHAQDDTSNQIWADFIVTQPWNEHWQFGLDMQGQAELDRENWWSLRATPKAEHFVTDWLDFIGEALVAYTLQQPDLRSLELSPRIGFRLHLFNEVLDYIRPERIPLTRLDLYNLTRLEYRAFWYSDDTSAQSWRLRSRLGGKVAINHRRLSEARTLYGILDVEVFIPLGDDIPETFANKYRIRVGFGYRVNYKWRFETLYVFDDSRNTLQDDFTQTSNVLDFRVKRYR
jgi:hypothetical protein